MRPRNKLLHQYHHRPQNGDARYIAPQAHPLRQIYRTRHQRLLRSHRNRTSRIVLRPKHRTIGTRNRPRYRLTHHNKPSRNRTINSLKEADTMRHQTGSSGLRASNMPQIDRAIMT
jgi:hypothetical protein